MAIIKCKMCGGDLTLIEGQSVAECEYCGSRQTVPVADNEKKLTLFARANRLRASCEFDKAAGIYESIVADFPDEAEAYWGLVLCKYGIEYVDDPATGKKIPTCHRSSFDSIMDDANFEQALENADAVARKVYREEAKQIEEIRKGIIAVSSNEQPYDIFICYKETDENGERTLDSVLAQDIYDTLVSRDYRTFFARITLEDKLGMEYEPYIFAALNSAKIMLAIGTDYEYYNAVWVKNEWSRYLKLMTQDKTKHLIPCYKGIDAYDMPKEFARLQAQDLGKVGAMQDLIRGIEKILPKKNISVIQERVVVGGGGDNKIASLLDRGNMALEDGNWAKADSFFEDVLNNDSRNAQAYIGKTLAMEKCRTLDALKRKRLESHPTLKAEALYIPERTAHVEQMAEQYSLPGYVEEMTIRGLYPFGRKYDSLVSGYQQQYREEELWWENHRQLSRAVKFASGPVAENLKAEKQHLLSQLADRVKKAQEADARSVARLEAAYDAHVAEADVRAEQKYTDALAQREKDYDYWLGVAKTEERVEQLKLAVSFFDRWKDYKDSKNLAEHCRKRIADITAEQKRKEEERRAAEAVEAEKRRIAEAKAAAARKKRNTVIGTITGIVAVAAIAVFLVMTKVVIPGNEYKAAEALLAAGQYEEAIAAFEALGGYQDAQAQAKLAESLKIAAEKKAEEERIAAEKRAEEERKAGEYSAALALLEAGDYEAAITAFGALGDYSDSREKKSEAAYAAAEALLEAGDYKGALQRFNRIKNYKDSAKKAEACELLLFANVQPGETIQFGDNGGNPIPWRVLANEGNRILVITQNIFTNRHYQSNQNDPKFYKDSPIRTYLNESFYKKHLSEAEQSMILETKLKTNGGDVNDRVFLLSDEEAALYFASDEDRKPANGGEWFLRTVNNVKLPVLGYIKPIAMYVKSNGEIYQNDWTTDYERGIRPAMWIDVSGYLEQAEALLSEE